MPLFGSGKFTAKKAPIRKQSSLSSLNTLDESTRKHEFGDDPGPIALKLGGHQVTFENGEWITEAAGGVANQREVVNLKQQNQKLLEENNLLKLKVDILLDLLAQTTAEHNAQQDQLEALRAAASAAGINPTLTRTPSGSRR